MLKFIDEFETLFEQLERMGTKTKIPETHKAPLIFASIGNSSPLESIVAELRTQCSDQITREAVTVDVIKEWSHLNSCTNE